MVVEGQSYTNSFIAAWGQQNKLMNAGISVPVTLTQNDEDAAIARRTQLEQISAAVDRLGR
jgi:hypothetical protein